MHILLLLLLGLIVFAVTYFVVFVGVVSVVSSLTMPSVNKAARYLPRKAHTCR